MFSAYKFAIKGTTLAGPTKFSIFLKALLNHVKENMNLQMYHCMLIITDGEIHDMRETKDLIVECSDYPLSIIIVGIGDADFSNMVELDGDDVILRNSKGHPTKRDIV